LPINYYSELAGIMVDCSILIKLIKIYLPSLYNHLIEIGYELSLNNLLYKWFVSVFIQNLSQELSFIIWDLLFLEGSIVMFKGALALLKIIKRSVLSKESLEDIHEAFDEGTKHLNDHKTLIYYLVVRKFEFDLDFICKNRIIFQPAIIENIVKNNENKIRHKNKSFEDEAEVQVLRRASYVKNVAECYPEWPLCIYDNNYKYNVVSFLIFKVHDSPNIIENYFNVENSQKIVRERDRKNIKNEKQQDKNIIKRNSHEISNNSNTNSNSHTSNKIKNSKNENQPRRRKSSTESFCKIYLENFEDSALANSHHDNKDSTKIDSPNREENFEFKLKVYKDLLIERRPHVCPEKDNTQGTEKLEQIKGEGNNDNYYDHDHEIIFNSDYKVQESYVNIKEKDIFHSAMQESKYKEGETKSKFLFH
jgi:hypothetical protein